MRVNSQLNLYCRVDVEIALACNLKRMVRKKWLWLEYGFDRRPPVCQASGMGDAVMDRRGFERLRFRGTWQEMVGVEKRGKGGRDVGRQHGFGRIRESELVLSKLSVGGVALCDQVPRIASVHSPAVIGRELALRRRTESRILRNERLPRFAYPPTLHHL